MDDIIPIEIIEDDNDNTFEEIANITNEYSKIDKANEKLEKVQEEFLHEGKIPDREVAKQVSTTDTIIDLAMATLARSSAMKLVKMEKFLSQIEDQLFNEDTLSSLSKGDLLQLYSQIRLLRNSTLQNVRDIRKEIDFTELEIKLMSANAKGDLSNVGQSVNEILEKIINDETILEKSIETQMKEIDA